MHRVFGGALLTWWYGSLEKRLVIEGMVFMVSVANGQFGVGINTLLMIKQHDLDRAA